MYYTSQNKSELKSYNDLVTQGEKYDGVFTTKWSEIIENPISGEFAILKHSKYETNLNEVDVLDDSWFSED